MQDLMYRDAQEIHTAVPVLDYSTIPRPSRTQIVRETFSQFLNFCGGIDSFLFYLSWCFFAFGFFGMVPCLTIWWILIERWSKRSRWF